MLNNDYFELLNSGLNVLQIGTRKEQEDVLNRIWEICSPIERNEVYNEIQKFLPARNNFITYDTSVLLDEDIKLNLNFYCNKLWQKLQKEQGTNSFISFGAINYIYANNVHLRTDILYEKNGETLNISKLLDAINYGLSIANIIFEASTEEFEIYITVLKGLNKIFNNDRPENPLKDLSYALDVFYKIQNYFETNPEKKRENKIEALSVSLFIDFLTR